MQRLWEYCNLGIIIQYLEYTGVAIFPQSLHLYILNILYSGMHFLVAHAVVRALNYSSKGRGFESHRGQSDHFLLSRSNFKTVA